MKRSKYYILNFEFCHVIERVGKFIHLYIIKTWVQLEIFPSFFLSLFSFFLSFFLSLTSNIRANFLFSLTSNITANMLRNGLNRAYCSVTARLKCHF